MSERRLAAILFSDIVGYTVLMGADEDKAFEILRLTRDIHTQFIEEYHGVLIKEMGDGNLVHFPSAVNAVKCAMAIQQKAREKMNSQIRIGIHLGDVTFENEDVFGDGVNIASRLQSIADPGGIYISESIQKSIRAKKDIDTKYLGEIKLKNVDYPIKIYAISGEGLPMPSPERIKKLLNVEKDQKIYKSYKTYIIFIGLLISALWFKNWGGNDHLQISSLVFLPFDNFIGSDTLEYLLAGMHDALIGEVGKIGSIRVPGTRTANSFKGGEKSFPEIASELNVDAGVETTVTYYEDKLCFNVKLLSAYPEEKLLWRKEYKVNKGMVQNWYRELAKEISRELKLTLTSREEKLLAPTDSINPVAYDLYMKGKFYLDQINDASLKIAIEYFKLASKKEPEWALPYAGLAEAVGYQIQMSFVSVDNASQIVQGNLDKALALDPISANSHYLKAIFAVWRDYDWERGESEFLSAIALNPNFARARMFYAHLLTILRRTNEALFHAKLAEELDPLNPFNLGLYADVLHRAGNCEEASDYAKKALSIEPNHYFAAGELLIISQCLGEFEKAFDIKKQFYFPLWEQYELTENLTKIFVENGWIAFVEEEIKFHERLVKMGASINMGHQYGRYLQVGNLDKAFYYFQKMYEMNDPNLPYISAMDIYNKMKTHPEYLELLKELNLSID